MSDIVETENENDNLLYSQRPPKLETVEKPGFMQTSTPKNFGAKNRVALSAYSSTLAT
jgi:hypothetical protein